MSADDGKAMDVALGNVVREEREVHGWSQRELAGAAGLHTGAINLIESGRASARIETLTAIARALGRSPSELLVAAEREVTE